LLDAPPGIATLEDTVADLNAAALKPCDYCADYEYKVVVMQEEVRQAHQEVRDTEAKVAVAVGDVEKRIDEATLRNSRHLMRSMDDLERKMALKASRQLKAQDEQNAANTAVIKEALDKQVGCPSFFFRAPTPTCTRACCIITVNRLCCSPSRSSSRWLNNTHATHARCVAATWHSCLRLRQSRTLRTRLQGRCPRWRLRRKG